MSKLSTLISNELRDLNLNINDVDFFIPHQANIRIIDSIAKNIKIEKKKIISTVAECANTSAASIPISLDILAQKHGNTIPESSNIIMAGIGAGMTWGSVLYKH